ncbi:hypothetical protein BT69DRAFT_1276005 [Atractiella rhizophila]|nr:hypothetical protein BT69DRAFT_1276005 [Atractiella rhizophila]
MSTLDSICLSILSSGPFRVGIHSWKKLLEGSKIEERKVFDLNLPPFHFQIITCL